MVVILMVGMVELIMIAYLSLYWCLGQLVSTFYILVCHLT
jgi:hypothetical protein